jgi:hypothetical protein
MSKKLKSGSSLHNRKILDSIAQDLKWTCGVEWRPVGMGMGVKMCESKKNIYSFPYTLRLRLREREERGTMERRVSQQRL